MPFFPLLKQVTSLLNYLDPDYQILHDRGSTACVIVRADSDCIPCVYVGWDTDNAKSCEVAAGKAVCDLVKKYEIVIEDVTALRKEMSVDLRCTPIETIEHLSDQYISWFTVIHHKNSSSFRCLFSDYCPGPAAAKQNLARKVVDYLIDVFNLQIVDANYRETTCRFDAILCTLDRESYLRAKERVLGIKEELEPSALLVEQDCITSVGKEFQVPVSVSPDIPSNKRSLWSVVGEGLDASFKRIRFSKD
uniref:Uncharacterized protein n=1 Tax=Chenopodium quinoa TaxID=63459 RepID=A0A803MT03_CHEQI